MKSVIGYVRVSTVEQDYTSQIEQVSAYCKVHDYNLLSVYTDKSTGSNTNRPGYKDMITAIEKQGGSVIEGVIVVKLDRLGRSIRDLLGFVDFLSKHNVGFCSVIDNIDTSTA